MPGVKKGTLAEFGITGTKRKTTDSDSNIEKAAKRLSKGIKDPFGLDDDDDDDAPIVKKKPKSEAKEKKEKKKEKKVKGEKKERKKREKKGTGSRSTKEGSSKKSRSKKNEEPKHKKGGKKRVNKPLPKVANSSDDVLKKVLVLGKEERQKSQLPEQKLKDLKLSHATREVDDLDADHVRTEIEKLVVTAAKTILDGNGFSFNVPSRAAGNQLYVPELDRIVLKENSNVRSFTGKNQTRKTAIMTRVSQLIYELCIRKIHVTKRDLFYTDVKLFKEQRETDDILEDVACMIGSTRSSLKVVASEKGIVVGRVNFLKDGDFIDCTKMGSGGKAIPPFIDKITDIKGDAKFILLVEKDAAFMRLAEDRFYNQYPCIILTAKGQPDVATRLFLKKVKTTLNIPVLAMVDSDPYGLKILSVYTSGSKNMSYDSASLTTRDIKWLGVRPSDLDKYNIPDQCRLEMTEHDIKTGKELLKEDFIKKNPEWMKELELMVQTKEKAEIQALSNFGFQYLTQVYLPLKLQQGDWI